MEILSDRRTDGKMEILSDRSMKILSDRLMEIKRVSNISHHMLHYKTKLDGSSFILLQVLCSF
jgi:hypothetical protein